MEILSKKNSIINFNSPIIINQGCLVEIDKKAISHNIKEIKKLSENTTIMPIVKADAYGHGLVETARICQKDNIDCFGVATVEEGITLRKEGLNKTILVLYNTPKNELERVLSNNLSISVFDKNLVNDLNKEAIKKEIKAKVHIPIDTGMGWYGINPGEAENFINYVKKFENIIIEGLYSHFAKTSSKKFSLKQITAFRKVIKLTKELGISPKYIHMAKSSGIMLYKHSLLNMIRPGLMLYGIYPKDTTQPKVNLKPAMSVKTRIFQIRNLPKNSPISYDGTYLTKKDSKIAILPIGYSNGLSRYLSNRGKVIIKGRKFPIVGNICMNICMVDITGGNIKNGDIATILGKDNGSTISANEIANTAHTTCYEILTNFGLKNSKIYINTNYS